MLARLRSVHGSPLGLVLLGALGLSGCASSPLPGWRVSASLGGCEAHRGVVITDADGAAQAVPEARQVLGERVASLPGNLDLIRGSGGWWVLGFVDHLGHVWWLADDADAPEQVATGRYVGVVEAGDGELLGVRELSWGGWGAAERWAMVLDRFERGPQGWVVTVEVARFNDVRPHRAIADEQGRTLALVRLPGWSFEERVLVRVEGQRLRPVGWLPSELHPGYQLSRTADADLLVSTMWPADYDDEDKQPTLILRKLDDDHYASGALVRACRAKPLARAGADAVPEPLRRGLVVEDGAAMLLPTYADLGEVVDYINTLPRPLELYIGGVELRGQHRELLRIEPGVWIEVFGGLPPGITDARPDLFDPASLAP